MSGQEWRLRAACRDTDPDAAFVGERSPEGRKFIREFCRPCPVRANCLEFALQYNDPGIYGGMTQNQRIALKRRLGRRRTPRPCGTDAGYHRHRRVPEEPCRPCLLAHNTTTAEQARAKKAAA